MNYRESSFWPGKCQRRFVVEGGCDGGLGAFSSARKGSSDSKPDPAFSLTGPSSRGQA